MKRFLELKVNGESREVIADPSRTLLEVLREDLGLTGAKRACDDGSCGACTILADGQPVLACLMLAVDAQGKEILTIEGLANEGKLHPIQQTFVERGAIQCGFCTPGMILSAKALLDQNPKPNEEEVRRGISGNLCRCTGYVKIVEAIMGAAQKL